MASVVRILVVEDELVVAMDICEGRGSGRGASFFFTLPTEAAGTR